MESCSILVPHVDTLPYLKFCVDQIRKYRHQGVLQEIIIIDQSQDEVYQELWERYHRDQDIRLLHIPKVDHGYAIDCGLRVARYEYCVILDCDAFPIHPNWLYVPIELIKTQKLSFVGTNCAVEWSYADHGSFFHIMNCYQTSRTSLARYLSEKIGFVKPENRSQAGLVLQDDSWGPEGADSGVLVQWFSDQHQLGNKLTFEFTSHLGVSNEMGIYGIVIEDMVFHLVFGYGEDWIGDLDQTLGPEYLQLRKRIRAEGLSESLIRELIARSTKRKDPRRLNGQWVNAELDALIETLKQEGESQHSAQESERCAGISRC